MDRVDVLIIGGGVSGACFAYHAARAGRGVCVVEAEAAPGGCLASVRTDAGFWFELGAHTCYNSYGAFLEVLEGVDLLGHLQPRAKPVLRFLDGTALVPGKNLGVLLRLFRKGELLRAVPRWRGASQAGETVRSYYSRLVGPTNYDRVLGPMLSAVPSQPPHDFPADMLFKKRPRDRRVRRSFTLPGGLRTAVERILDRPGIELRAGHAAVGIERDVAGFVATLDDGTRLGAERIALALPPSRAASLLEGVAPEAARAASRVAEARIESLGCVVPRDRVDLPEATFLIPLDDVFYSVVTRDVVPDPAWRAFTFHFKPDLDRGARLRRAAEVLRLAPGDLEIVNERPGLLPAPALGHPAIVAELDRALAGGPVAVTGNWFGGLSIEDCALRSRAEWSRVATPEPPGSA